MIHGLVVVRVHVYLCRSEKTAEKTRENRVRRKQGPGENRVRSPILQNILKLNRDSALVNGVFQLGINH